MSDNLVKSLSSALAAPSTLDQQRTGQGFYLDEHTPALPSEGNMLTIMTLKDLYKTQNGASPEEVALTSVHKEESKYLMHALKILAAPTKSDGDEAAKKKAAAAQRIQNKFGKDLAGATQLAQLIKQEAVKAEFEADIKPIMKGFERVEGRALD